MAIYEYENAKGERREIVASMKDPPPEVVWHRKGFDHPFVVFGDGEVQEGYEKYTRVWSNQQAPVVINHAIRSTHNGLPVSRTLPLRAGGQVVSDGAGKIKVHADGMRTDLRGRPICATKEDQKRIQAHYQCERE